MLQIVAIFFGPDKPYLLELLAGFIRARSGNIEDATAKVYGSWANLFVIFSGSELATFTDPDDKRELEGLLGGEIRFEVAGEPAKADGVEYRDRLHGFKIITLDKPGLIARTSAVIKAHKISVVRFDGRCARRDEVIAGVREKSTVFHQSYEVRIPTSVDDATFHEAIEAALGADYTGSVGAVAIPLFEVPRLY